MDAVLADESLLSKAQLRELSIRTNGPSLRRLGAQALLYALSAAVLILAEHPAWIVAALALNAAVQFGMFGMLHEACHRSAFTRTWLSELAGWFAALAQPMSPALMRAFHFAHHRHTHELDADPELGGLAFMAAWPRGLGGLVTRTGLPVLFARAGWALFAALVPPALDRAWTKVLPFVATARRRRIAWEARLLVGLHAALITVAATLEPGVAWIYVGMLLGHMMLSRYITCEHRGLPLRGSILARTRSLEVHPIVRWLVWNMPYHAEHHGWPAVPWHTLPALHTQVEAHLVHRCRPRDLYRNPPSSDS